MKNRTNSLEKFSIFQSKPQPNTGLNNSIKTPSLTAVATAVGVSSLASAGTIESEAIFIYVACVALGIAFLPGFASGLLLGSVCSLVNIALAILMHRISPLNAPKSSYYYFLINNPLTATIVGPSIEEILFRGLLLPAMLAVITTLFPITTTIMFWGTGITLAATIAIGLTAGLFGLAHIANDHEGAYRQVFFTTLFGIACGVIALQLGLWAAIGAHIVNNSIMMALMLPSSTSFLQSNGVLTEPIDARDQSELSMDETLIAPSF